ncbi:MAG: choice-of-anchor D domain-containing protein, partial [Gaiellaceae bacterium]
MSGLRQRSVRYWLVGVSLLAFAVMYVSPLVIALRTPAYEAPPAPLPNVAFPSVGFPSLKVPKVAPPVPLPKPAERAPAPAADRPAASAPAPAAGTAPAPRGQATVPVVTDQFSLTPPAPKDAPGEAAKKDPFESVPVVDDAIGTIPPPAAPTVTPAAAPAAAPEAVPADGSEAGAGSGSGDGAINPIPDEATTVAAGTSGTEWAVAQLEEELRKIAEAMQGAVEAQGSPPPSDVRSVTYTAPAEPAPAPGPAPDPEPAPPAPEEPAAPVDPQPEVEPAQTITGPDEEVEVASTTVEPGQQPVLAPADVSEPETLVDEGLTEELAGDLQVAATLDFGTAAIGSPVTLTLQLANLGTADLTVNELSLVGAPGPFSLPAGSPLTIAPGGSASVSIAFAPAKAGSYTGRLLVATDDPDASVEVELAGQATAWQLDGSTARGPPAADGWNHVLRIGSAGAELVDASGYVDAIALDGVTAIALAGSDGDDVLTLGGAFPIPVSFDGGGGNDTLVGSSADSTWNVTGAGAGSVGGVTFAGIENLTGAAGNEDRFVVAASGSVAGTVEGGDGGFDTIVVSGGGPGGIRSSITGPQSGTIARGADVLTYAGLEPVGIQTPAGPLTIDGTAGADVIVIRDRGTASDGEIEVTISTGETHQIAVAGLTGLTINALGGIDQITIEALDTLFAANLTINAGELEDVIRFRAKTGAGTWTFNGGDGVDQLEGPNATTAWVINAADAGTVAGNAFTSVESLIGGTGADTFTFTAVGSGFGLFGTITGGTGPSVDTVAGPNANVGWIINAAGGGSIDTNTFTDIEAVTGGTANDRFTLDVDGALTGGINGGDGDDTVALVAGPNSRTIDLTGALAGTASTTAFTNVEDVGPIFLSGANDVRATRRVAGGMTVESVAGGLAPTTITWVGATVPNVVIDTAGGNDKILIDSLLALTPTVKLHGGGDDDTIVVALVNTLAGKIKVDGGSGVDGLEDYTGVSAANTAGIEYLPAGIPLFTEQGPGPTTQPSGGLEGDKFPTSGAINTVAIQPGNDSVMFAATVNGGVWRTTNGGSTWQALTDHMPSLSISTITIAPFDADGDPVDGTTPVDQLVLYAGTGALSGFSSRGGLTVGLYKSIDGGGTWRLMAPELLSSVKITGIVATSATNVVVAGMGPLSAFTNWLFPAGLTADNIRDALALLPAIGPGGVTVAPGGVAGTFTITFVGRLAKRNVPQLKVTGGAATITTTTEGDATNDEVQTLTVGADPFYITSGDFPGGVFRSTDGGVTFTRILSESATDLVGDPAVANRLYAGVIGAGVYRSDDGGANWKLFVNGLTLDGDVIDNDGNGALNDVTETAAGVARFRLTVRANKTPLAGDPNPVYVSLLSGDPKKHLMGIFQSTPTATGAAPADWTQGLWTLVGLLGPAGMVAPAPPSAALNYSHSKGKTATAETSIVFTAGTGTLATCTTANCPKLTRTVGDWRADGFAVGQTVTISGSTVAGNNGTGVVVAVTSTILYIRKALTTNTATVAAGLKVEATVNTPTSMTGQQPQPNLGGQGLKDSALAADSKGNLYIAGDTGLVTAFYPGNVWKWVESTKTWSQLVDQTAVSGITRPHADTRNLVLNSVALVGSTAANTGSLFNLNDGGIWRLDLATGAWTSLNAGSGTSALRITELLSIAYDELNGTIIGGAQDNGAQEQAYTANDGIDNDSIGSPGFGIIDDPGERFPWISTSGGDGNAAAVVAVDTDGVAGLDHVVRFVLSNNTTYFTQRLYSGGGTLVATGTAVTLGVADTANQFDVTGNTGTGLWSTTKAGLVNGSGPFLLAGTNIPLYLQIVTAGATTTFRLRQFAPAGPVLAVTAGTKKLTPLRKNAQGVQNEQGLVEGDRDFTAFTLIPYAVNSVEPNRMALGQTALYESSNYLTTVTQTVTGTSFSSIVYGGKLTNTGRWEVLYAATTANHIYVRLPATVAQPSASVPAPWIEFLPGSREVRQVTIDPRDYTKAWAVTDGGVYQRNPGACTGTVCRWDLISQKLFNANFASVEYLPSATAGEGVLLVGSSFGIYRAFNPTANVEWTLLGRNVPNSLVTDINYVGDNSAQYTNPNPAARDLLVVGTQGRGAWTIGVAAGTIQTQPTLTINGTDLGNDTVLLLRNVDDPALLDVTINGQKVYSTPLRSIQRILFDGKGGNDTLTVDSTNGGIVLNGGISFTGGAGTDTLLFTGGVYSSVTKTPTTAPTTRGAWTWLIDLSRVVESRQSATFTDFLNTEDTVTNSVTQAAPHVAAADALRKTAVGISIPQPQLALIGQSLPSVINGPIPQAPAPPPVALPVGGVTAKPFEASKAGSWSTGLERIFDFEDGTSLLDLISTGAIADTAALIAQLELLAGAGNVEDQSGSGPLRIRLDLRRQLTGEGILDVAFEQFGGSAALRGSIDVSVDVRLNIVFGVDADGNGYIETNGAGPEIVFENIQVQGRASGTGRLGFLDVKLKDIAVTATDVNVSIDLTSGTNQIAIADLTTSGLLAAATITAGGGPLTLTSAVEAAALLPWMDEPFDLGGATLSATWADASNPLGVSFSLSGGLNDLMKLRPTNLLEVLRTLDDVTTQLEGVIPPEIQQGLDRVISIVQAFDDLITSTFSDPLNGQMNSLSLQEIITRLGTALNQQLSQFGMSFTGGVLTWDFDLPEAILGALALDAPSASVTVSDLRFTFGVDFAKLIDLGGGASFSILNALSIKVTGELTGIELLGVLEGGVTFEISRQLVDVNLDGNASTVELSEALLVTFGLSLDEDAPVDPETRYLKVGPDGYALTLEDGTLVIAVLSAPEPLTGTDTRRWIAVEAIGVGGNLLLGTFASATATGIDVLANSASGERDPNGVPASGDEVAAAALNWTTAIDFQTGDAFDADAVVVLGETIDRATDELRIEGELTDLNILDLLTGAAGFEIVHDTVDADVDGGGKDLDEATLLTIGIDLDEAPGPETRYLWAGVDGVGLRLLDGQIRIAALAPASDLDDRRWLAVDADGISGDVNVSGITVTATGMNVSFNTASGTGATALDWNTAVDLDETASSFDADVVLILGQPLTLTGELLEIGGTLSLNLFGFVFGTVSFDFSRLIVDVELPDLEILTDATLMTFDLDVIDLTIGIPGGIGFTIGTGSLGLSIVLPKLPTVGIDTRRWFSIEGLLGDLNFPGLPGFSLSDLGDLLPEINLALGDFDPDGLGGLPSLPAVAFDWGIALDLPGGLPDFGDLLTIGGFGFDLPSAMLRARGTANIDLFDFVTGTVTYAFEQETVDVDADGDGIFNPAAALAAGGPRGPPDVNNATLTRLGLGVDPTEGLRIGIPGSVGLSISSGTLAVALVTPSPGPTDSRFWLAVEADDFTASLEGIPGLTLSAEDVSIRINRAGGSYDASPLPGDEGPAAELDWTDAIDIDEEAATFAPDAVVVATGPSTDYTITSAGNAFSASGLASVAIGGFLAAAGGFSVTRGTLTGPLTVGGIDLAGAKALAFTLTTPSVFVGLGAHVVEAGDPGLAGDLATGDIGIGASAATFALNSIVTAAGDRYLGINATGLTGALTGIDGLTFQVEGVTVSVNQATDGLDAVLGARLDWDSVPLATGFQLPIDELLQLHAEGTATIDAFGFVLVSGGFAVTKRELTGAAGAIDLAG